VDLFQDQLNFESSFLTLTQITQAILHDENTILPVLFLVKDYLGINEVFLGLPAIINKLGISRALKIALNSNEKDYLNCSKI
jgi:L-lactate dehydrogenase